MAGSKHRTLDPAQAHVVSTILQEEFAAVVRDKDPGVTSYRNVTKWASARRAKIFAEETLFKTVAVRAKLAEFNLAVDRCFRNYYRKLRTDAQSGQAHQSGPSAPHVGTTLVDRVAPRPTALDLYEVDVRDEVMELVGQDVGEYHPRLLEMWLALEEDLRGEYEEQAETIVPTVEQRRRSLEAHFSNELDAICRDKALGGLMAITVFAFRDSDGQVQTPDCYGRVDDITPGFGCEEDEREALSAFTAVWREYAMEHLPTEVSRRSSPSSKTIIIPRNPQGLPFFPAINQRSILPGDLEDLIVRYLEALWTHLRRPHHPRTLPWEDVANDPSTYYDTQRYDYMCFDRDALENLPRLYEFATELEKHCGVASSDPFAFSFSVEDPIAQQPPQTSMAAGSNSEGSRETRKQDCSTSALIQTSAPLSTSSTRGNDQQKAIPTANSNISVSPSSTSDTVARSSTASLSPADRIRVALPSTVQRLPPSTRSSKRSAPSDFDNSDETDRPASLAPPSRGTRSRQVKDDAEKRHGNDKPPQKRARRSNKKGIDVVSTVAKPAPAPADQKKSKKGAKKNNFGGWQFDNSINFGAIRLVDYQKEGGTILQESDFIFKRDSGRELGARAVASKDPAWFAGSELWRSAILERP
ncbi:unnamed protein product [Peniophora sp. CBMAI 1063]|nr:unnamed protein product [Peniophora sp. CBMAI 1063]